jgi:N-glycosylase/DNA lyase
LEFTIGPSSAFNLGYTLDSGQVFRWERREEWWYGVVNGGVLKVRQDGELLTCESSTEAIDGAFVRRYFRLDDDIQPILFSIMKDTQITRAVQEFHGMRLIRQSGWECLASFVLATNSNIPRIKRMVSNVCEALGRTLEFEGSVYHLFPQPADLAAAPTSVLKRCGLGYRAPFLKKVAQAVDAGRIDFGELSVLDYERARDLLLARLSGAKLLLGVGPKVADCVLLFSCEKEDAFPIDVWIGRILARLYPSLVEPKLLRKLRGKKAALTLGEYQRLSSAVRHYFGPYAGYAQQYLFMLARSEDSTSTSSRGSSSEGASSAASRPPLQPPSRPS